MNLKPFCLSSKLVVSYLWFCLFFYFERRKNPFFFFWNKSLLISLLIKFLNSKLQFNYSCCCCYFI